jgi:SAM-dependent methyltransferase
MSKNRVGLFDFDRYESIIYFLDRVLERDKKNIRSTLFWEAVETGTTVRGAADNFGLTPHVYNEKMQRFYEETDAFVFELIVGHMRDACKKIDARVIESVDQFAKGDRVLCLGDGIGTDTLRFVEDGFDVTYFEFEGPSSQIAQHRFSRAGVESDVEQIHQLGNIPYEKYDVVINREVLEHVPDPPEVIKDIRNYLDEDGLAIITESFSRIQDRFPTHLASNRKYAGETKQLFVKEGFTFIDSYPGDRPIVLRKTERSDTSRFDSLPPSYPIRKFLRRVAKKVLSSIPA